MQDDRSSVHEEDYHVVMLHGIKKIITSAVDGLQSMSTSTKVEQRGGLYG
jgi:hypothetical protein